MTIRAAESSDIPRIVEMGVQFIADSAFWTLGPANPDRIAVLAMHLMDEGVLLVADDGGQVVGMLGGHVYQHPMIDAVFASEAAWWVDPAHRGRVGAGLRVEFERWAQSRGATHVVMVAPTDRVAEHYRKLGYVSVEQSWARRV